jgi:molybdopterin synthase catalytic subunit
MPPSPTLQIRLCASRFEPLKQLADWTAGQTGAALSQFIGRVRATSASGECLEALELEHYPGMTERQLEQLAMACGQRHGVSAVLIQHRVGLIPPGEAIVLVAVAADRRGPAQRCCQELLEALKHDAPFWKREWSGGRSHWIQGNTPLEAPPAPTAPQATI